MKIIFCTDILLGAACTENVDVKLSNKWKALRTEKFSELADKAIPENASYIAIMGTLFGQERISETTLDSLFQVVTDQKYITFLAFLSQAEYSRISYRNNIPENLHIICVEMADSYRDDNVFVCISDKKIQMQFNESTQIVISKNEEGNYVITGIKEGDKELLHFEATGYDDATAKYGYSVLEWSDGAISTYKEIEDNKFSYQTIEVKLFPEDNQKELVRKLIAAVSQFKYETFLRINITGKTEFGFMVKKDEITRQLKSRIFFVEVYDNTMMDIDEASFDNDISLRSEFVRLALQDNSLSEAERNRILSCGWNVLNGKEVSAE